MSSLTGLWRSTRPTAAELSRARRRLHAKAAFITVIVALSYWSTVISDWNITIRIGSAAALAIGLIAVATSIMHDANHGAFSRHRWLNRLVSYVADILGTSSWLWRFKQLRLDDQRLPTNRRRRADDKARPMTDDDKTPESSKERERRLRALTDNGDTISHEEYTRRSRRSFLAFGALGIGGYLGFRNLQNRPTDDTIPDVIRSGLEWNERVWETVQRDGARSRTFDTADIEDLRVNGRIGLDDEVAQDADATWEIDLTGIGEPRSGRCRSIRSKASRCTTWCGSTNASKAGATSCSGPACGSPT